MEGNGEIQGISELLVMADQYYTQFDYGNAKICYQKALEFSKDSEEILVPYALLCIDINEIDTAKNLLHSAINQSPKSMNYRKYFALADLYEGNQSLEL